MIFVGGRVDTGSVTLMNSELARGRCVSEMNVAETKDKLDSKRKQRQPTTDMTIRTQPSHQA